MATRIEWSDETWNPILGCSVVSPGCSNCYAAGGAKRRAAMLGQGNPHEETWKDQNGRSGWNGRVVLNTETRWAALRHIRGKRVFVNSLSDLFHSEALAAGYTRRIMDELVAHRAGNSYQILTKRPEAAAAYYREHPALHGAPGIWLGTSVEDARVKSRIDILRGIPAALRFLSCEPLIGPVGRLDLRDIHWVIAGGESGPRCRPMALDWAREIRDQCAAAEVPFFFKQHGGFPDKRGHAKAVLDGREWKQFPVAAKA
ncbi:DUF5131 family protein [Falsiroseomonas sp. E2-1-a20]|uniref:DUF5131 family protein n=1 Tax=Falsiroseomonas sp. E2-1-a20 TaxID=3239300 RepID=UPI003F351F82